MSSLRNFALILFLAGVGWAVYVAINKSPKPSTPLDTAPPWNPPQVCLPAPDTTALNSGTTAGLPPLTAPSNAGNTVSGPTSVLPQIAAPSVPEAPPSVAAPTAPSISLTPSSAPAMPFPAITPPAIGNPQPTTAIATPAPVSTAATATNVLASSAKPAVGDPAVPPPTILTPANSQSAAAPPPTRPAPERSLPVKSPSVMDTVKAQIEAGHYDDALLTLSKVYREPQVAALLGPNDFRPMAELLDQLAGTVIYSREHLLAAAYRVQPGDTLDGIAQRYNVPAELLAKINGIRESQLVPGQELKIIPGPFEAVIDLSRYELTLYVHDRYAGRFSIGVGLDQPQLEGTFMVREKKINPLYRGQDRVFSGDDPNNPLGRRLLDLGNQVAIHGTDNPRNIGRTEGPGVIRLSERELYDVYDILSVGSRVTIRR